MWYNASVEGLINGLILQNISENKNEIFQIFSA
jgi:hypothetical protein